MFLVCTYNHYSKYEDALAAIKAVAEATESDIVLKHNSKMIWNTSHDVPLPEFQVCAFHYDDKKVVEHGTFPDRETAVKAATKVHATTGMQTTVTDVNVEQEVWVSPALV